MPKTINDGAQYLLINDDWRTNAYCCGNGMFTMGCAIPDDTLFIPASNEPNGRACTDSWRMPRGSIPRCLQRFRFHAPLHAAGLLTNDSLSGELINLLKLKSGRTFDSDSPSMADDWSKMIWDLLRIAASKYSTRKNAQPDKFPRSKKYSHFGIKYMGDEYSHFCTERMGDRTLFDDMSGNDKNMEEISDDDRGVSVVLIESRLKSDMRNEGFGET